MSEEKTRWASVGLAVPLLFSCLQAFFSPLSPDGDLYFHLKCGEIIQKTGHWLSHDIFTYTQKGMPDESMHSWASQWIFWLIYQLSGELGLRFFYLALVSIILGMVHYFVWKRTRSLFFSLLASTLACLIQSRMPGLRPLVLAQVLSGIIILFLLAGGLNFRKSFCLLFLGLVWFQVHASCVLYLPLMIFFLVPQLLQNDLNQREKVLCIITLSLAFLIPFFSPFGWGIYSYALALSKTARAISGGEWASLAPIQILTLSPLKVLRLSLEPQDLIIILGLTFSLLFILKVRKKWQEGLFAFTFFALPLLSIRHLSFSFLPIAFLFSWVPRNLRISPVFAPLLSLVLCLGFHAEQSYGALSSIEKFSNFLEESEIQGNAFNYHGWGSYLIFKHFPRIRISSDNRSLLHENYFKTLLKIKGQTLSEKRGAILQNLPAQTDFLIFTTGEHSLANDLDPKEWWVAFENNEATLAIRRTLSNQENISKVMNYYKKHQISPVAFSPMNLESLYRANPVWFLSFWESSSLGKFSAPGFKILEAEKEKKLLQARGLL